MLFWAPFLVFLSWGMGKPFSLLFGTRKHLVLSFTSNISPIDFFEISILICACFIVNYVTADSKTNWAEGLAMVAFYIIIVSRFKTGVHFVSHDFFKGRLCMALPWTEINRNHAYCGQVRGGGLARGCGCS
jgi:hypothetical protein